ncbi:MAG: tetratricopeptide repeat protein, partial [Pseudomonadota bacterium]
MENIYHYNQAGSDDDIVQSFIARHDVLDALARRLSSVEDDSVAVHHVLIGSRGMGKTSLLRRLAVEVDRDPKLSKRFVALRFREEQYNVLNLASFWRNCMESLAEWAEKSGLDKLADRLDEIASGNHCQDDDTAEECFEAEMVALDRRAVLLVDNLDTILSALSKESNWKLRRVLQSKMGPIVVGAASQPLKATANRDAAFYEFFQPHYLIPLDLAETRACMLTLASRRGPKGKSVQFVVRNQPERLQTLHALTGGNPRVISLIYRLLESSDTHEVMSDLNALLDDVTPYYKHKIEEYSSTHQRAVIDAISLNWDPITTGDLSQITGIKSTTISPILVKLRKDGMIENVDVSGSYAGHQIVERFFNIWYLMRHGTRRTKQKMRWLVGFLTSFYSPKELMQLSSKFDSKKGLDNPAHPEYALALREALACEGHSFDGSLRLTHMNEWAKGEADVNFAGELEKSDENSIPDLFRPVWEAEKAGQNREILSEINKLPTAFDELERVADKEFVGRLLNIKGGAFLGLKDYKAALETFDALIARYGSDKAGDVRGRAVAAMLNKGLALDESGDLEASLATYDALVERYGGDEEGDVRGTAAGAMLRKGFALEKSGDLEAALATFDALIERYAGDQADSVREAAARAMQFKGLALDKSGDLEAALATFDALIERYAGDQAD